MVFGKVVEGLDVLKDIESVPTIGPRNKPEVPIKIVNCGEVLKGKDNGVVGARDGTQQELKSHIVCQNECTEL